MKKVVELENRWRAYKYKSAIFYIFIALLVAFVALLVFFIKMQVFDKSNPQVIAESRLDSAPKNPQNSTLDSANKADSANFAESSANSLNNVDSALKEQTQQNKITFICRQVTTNKLTVRKEASFKSSALGYYPQDSIFCVSESENGLVKTQNGWVSASDRYSQVVDVNMFVDTGFYKYQSIAQPARKPTPKTSVEEVKVFDTPLNSAKSNAESNIQPFAESKITDAPKPKKKMIITTGNITKEQVIEFKKADFRNRKDYATAIEVARYYYDVKDYENSIKWALNASNSNSKGKQKSESFIIYAKSLYLSGKQEQAISVLDRYVSTTNSKDAIDALNKMKQGII